MNPSNPAPLKPSPDRDHPRGCLLESLETRILLSAVQVIRDLSIDPRANGQPAYDQFVVSNGIGFFKRLGASSFGSLWTTNGVTATKVMEVEPGDHFLEMLPVKAGVAAVDSGDPSNPIWRSDGTMEGTYVIGSINVVHTTPGLSPAQSFNGRYYINNESIGGSTIAITDGYTLWSGVAEKWGGMCQYANGVVFNAAGGMYSIDNNNTITHFFTITPYGPDNQYTRVDAPFNVRQGIVFLVYQSQNGQTTYSLWLTDGTAQNTNRLPFAFPGNPQFVRIIGSDGQHALIDVSDSNGNDSIWSTDGTVAGTVPIITGPIGHDSSVIGDVNGGMLFETKANAASTDVTLWTTLGTAASTRQIAHINQPQFYPLASPYNNESVMSPARFVLGNAEAYFVASDPRHGTEIWRTDGTTAGTRLGVDVQPGPASSYPILCGVVGNRLVFNGVLKKTGHTLLSYKLKARLAWQPRRTGMQLPAPVAAAPFSRLPLAIGSNAAAKPLELIQRCGLDGMELHQGSQETYSQTRKDLIGIMNASEATVLLRI